MNVAFNKTAKQSTTRLNHHSYVANMAIDGDNSTKSFTANEMNQWWYVDLKTTTDIMYMVLKGYYAVKYNRALIVETRQQENSGAWKTCKNIGHLKTNPFNFTCDNPTNARFVQVRSTTRCVVHLWEFEVYARVAV